MDTMFILISVLLYVYYGSAVDPTSPSSYDLRSTKSLIGFTKTESKASTTSGMPLLVNSKYATTNLSSRKTDMLNLNRSVNTTPTIQTTRKDIGIKVIEIKPTNVKRRTRLPEYRWFAMNHTCCFIGKKAGAKGYLCEARTDYIRARHNLIHPVAKQKFSKWPNHPNEYRLAWKIQHICAIYENRKRIFGKCCRRTQKAMGLIEFEFPQDIKALANKKRPPVKGCSSLLLRCPRKKT